LFRTSCHKYALFFNACMFILFRVALKFFSISVHWDGHRSERDETYCALVIAILKKIINHIRGCSLYPVWKISFFVFGKFLKIFSFFLFRWHWDKRTSNLGKTLKVEHWSNLQSSLCVICQGLHVHVSIKLSIKSILDWEGEIKKEQHSLKL